MTRLIVILTIALSTLAGCGGGGEGSSTEDFVADANRICREGAAELDEVSREEQAQIGRPDSLEEQRQAVAAVLERTAEAYEPYMERLRALEPPADLAESWTSFLDGVGRAFDRIPELADATRTGDQAKLTELSEEFTQIAARRVRSRRTTGSTTACRSPSRGAAGASTTPSCNQPHVKLAGGPYRCGVASLGWLRHEPLEPHRGRPGVHRGHARRRRAALAGRLLRRGCTACGLTIFDEGTQRPAGARGVREILARGDQRHRRAQSRGRLRQRVPAGGPLPAAAGSVSGWPSGTAWHCRRSRSSRWATRTQSATGITGCRWRRRSARPRSTRSSPSGRRPARPSAASRRARSARARPSRRRR